MEDGMLAPDSSRLHRINLNGISCRCQRLKILGAFASDNTLTRVVVDEWKLDIARLDGESPEGFHDRLCRMLSEAAE
jgi:hypothetical protein